MKPSAYHRLSAPEKRDFARDQQRERPIACPLCDTQTSVAELPAHLATRCEGPKEPDVAARWVTFCEALESDGLKRLGISRATLWRDIHRGRVRMRVLTRDGQRKRTYLLRDIVRLMAARVAVSG